MAVSAASVVRGPGEIAAMVVDVTRRIFKYRLAPKIRIPMGAEILSVQFQNDEPTIWAAVNPDAAETTRYFDMVATGDEIPEGQYIGTAQSGPFVWHFFDGGEA